MDRTASGPAARVTAPMDETPRTYRLGGREKRGLLAGWRGGQVASVAMSLVFAVGALRALGGAAGAVVALASVLCGAFAACWPLRGRCLDEWVPALARYALRGEGWRNRAPFGGEEGAWRPRRPSSRTFGALSVGEVSSADGAHAPFGCLADGERATVSAVIAASGTGYALLGEDERTELIANWSAALAGVAREGTAIHRLQWIVRCRPNSGGVRAERLVAPAPGGLTPGSPASSYSQLVDATTRSGWQREVLVAVTVRRARAGLLASEVTAVLDALGSAGPEVHGVLGAGELSDLVAGIFDPLACGGRGPGGPLPLAARPEWAALRVDDCWHA
ncbi:MAG TPA: SCO6880 family protein, partial [Acidimicrobiales bacterium]|nr:SCO6880 family protein [Acidimicrobiales bacterium]